jgi:hypothetical protein
MTPQVLIHLQPIPFGVLESALVEEVVVETAKALRAPIEQLRVLPARDSLLVVRVVLDLFHRHACVGRSLEENELSGDGSEGLGELDAC